MLLLSNQPIQLIMVAYHRPNDLSKCVESIRTNTNAPYHLNIIDNSAGKIDSTLNSLAGPDITIYRNTQNLGKGRAIMTWYTKIAPADDLFVSIDSDLLVPPNWLTLMLIAAARVRQRWKLGALAPTIMNVPGQTFDQQLQSDLIMHRGTWESHFVHPTIYRNRHTAGPLFLIDRAFFEEVGGYVQTQLYGNDDGELCKAAHRRHRFVGIATDVEVIHLRGDATAGYDAWKVRNVRGNVDNRGYWD